MTKNKFNRIVFGFGLFSLVSCLSNPSGLTANFFKNRKWTCWESDDGNIKVYITGRYFGEYTSGVGTIKGGLNKFYYSSFVFNADGDPTSDYLNFYKFDGTYRSDYTYFIKAVKNGSKIDENKIFLSSSTGYEITLNAKSIDALNVDLRYVIRASLKSQKTGISFSHTFNSESFENGAVYYTNYNEERLLLSFGDNYRFTIKKGYDVVCTGSYNATKESARLTFDTNEIFDSNESIDFDLLFDNKIDS